MPRTFCTSFYLILSTTICCYDFYYYLPLYIDLNNAQFLLSSSYMGKLRCSDFNLPKITLVVTVGIHKGL